MNDLAALLKNQRHEGDAPFRILLMHGAGLGQESEFMCNVFDGLLQRGQEVVAVDFPYMQKATLLNKKQPPDRFNRLQEFVMQWMLHWQEKPVVLLGKSMGGRLASSLANQPNVKAWSALGYPFVAPTQKDADKIAARLLHLKAVKTPGLILQGTRDPFSKQLNIDDYISNQTSLKWLEDADHDFKTLKRSFKTQQQTIDLALDSFVAWL